MVMRCWLHTEIT